MKVDPPALSNETSTPAEMPTTLSAMLADYVACFRYDDIPATVRDRAKHLILDAVGVAIASASHAFAKQTLASLNAIGERGNCSIIGLNEQLPLRDAVLMNGMLVHGIDFDDTHLDGVVHPSASALPCALSLAEHLGLTGRELLAAYVLGVEIVTRIGMSAGYGFHRYGFHPTGLLAHFSCSLQAGWLLELGREQLTMAQGIVGSTAAASQEFLADGAWNKRMHPGWAGAAGITAAYLARGGFVSTRRPMRVASGYSRAICMMTRARSSMGEWWRDWARCGNWETHHSSRIRSVTFFMRVPSLPSSSHADTD